MIYESSGGPFSTVITTKIMTVITIVLTYEITIVITNEITIAITNEVGEERHYDMSFLIVLLQW